MCEAVPSEVWNTGWQVYISTGLPGTAQLRAMVRPSWAMQIIHFAKRGPGNEMLCSGRNRDAEKAEPEHETAAMVDVFCSAPV